MTFDLKYGFIKAGHSVMALEDTEQVHGHTTYRIHSRTSSTGFVDTFYSVRDRITSWVDTHTLATIQFEKSLHEGSYKKDYQVWFDYKNMLAYSNQDTLEIQTYMQDILSLFYYIRSLKLSVGDTIKLSNYDNDKISPFFLQVSGKEKVSVPAGKFRCLIIEPFVQSDFLFKYEGRLQIWLTDDANRIPVMMKSKATIGSMILELTHYTSGTNE